MTWTGIVTIYAFFQSLVMPGMAIALNCALLKRSLFAWGLFAVSCVNPFHRRFGLRPPRNGGAFYSHYRHDSLLPRGIQTATRPDRIGSRGGRAFYSLDPPISFLAKRGVRYCSLQDRLCRKLYALRY